MKQMFHLRENLEVTKVRKLTNEEFLEIMRPKKREEFIEKPN